MADPAQTYRSLMLRKAQQLAKEHGGIARIPRRIQRKLGFDVISKRKGHVISVRIPAGDLSPRISELKAELPAAGAFGPSKPEPDALGRYTPVVSGDNPTMDDFWIMQGWYREDKFGIRLIRAKWEDDEALQLEAVRFLIERVFREDLRKFNSEAVASNRLRTLLRLVGTPYKMLVATGHAYSVDELLEHAKAGKFGKDKLYPWEMETTPNALSDMPQVRVAAVRWLLWKSPKPPEDIHAPDYYEYGLIGMLANHFHNSHYDALVASGHAYSVEETLEHARTGSFGGDKLYPWQMAKNPKKFGQVKRNRIAAIKWLVWKAGDPRQLGQPLFREHRMESIMGTEPHGGSPYSLLVESGYAFSPEEARAHAGSGKFRTDKIYPWEMVVCPLRRFSYRIRENRTAATKWLHFICGYPPCQEMVGEDFYQNGLRGLLDKHYESSPYRALLEAGLVTSADEEYMRSNRSGTIARGDGGRFFG